MTAFLSALFASQMPLQTAVVVHLATTTTPSPHPVTMQKHARHSAPMSVFSSHRKRIDSAANGHGPSTPVKPSAQSHYTIATETPPSSSKLATRPPTPVPECPPPPLSSQPTPTNPASSHMMPADVQQTVSEQSLAIHHAYSHSATLSPNCHSSIHRFPPTPPLPSAWNGLHDHAMCVLDTCNYSLAAIVKKLRSAFPELAASPLTQAMIDKRLRVLDQNPDIDYFRTGLEHATRQAMDKARRATETGPSGYDTRIPADPRVSTLTAPTSTIDSSIMSSIPSLPDLPEKLTRHGCQM